MNIKILMKLTAVLVTIVCIYVIVIWEPNLDGNKDRDYASITEESSNFIDNTKIKEENDIDVSSYDIEENNMVNSIYIDDIFVIEFGEINSRLSSNEKMTVDKVLSKLSVTDCIRVNKILNINSNESYDEALEFIKKRVLEKDYIQLEGALQQYLELS